MPQIQSSEPPLLPIPQNHSALESWVGRIIPWKQLNHIYGRLSGSNAIGFFDSLLQELRVDCDVAEADLGRIPKSGPLVAVANHPFGILDGALLASLLGRVRPDVKLLTNYLLDGIPELREACIFVDPFGRNHSAIQNRQALREAIAWLRRGGALAIFPAGEVSHLQWRSVRVTDPQWNRTAARLARITGATSLPVFFSGRNSVTFQFIGLLHPQLRTAWLMNEFVRQTGHRVKIRVGRPISSQTLSSLADDRSATEYLRSRTYLLQRRRPRFQLPPVKLVFRQNADKPLAAELPGEILAGEIAALDSSQRLFENSEFMAVLARAGQIPNLMQELGRLREVTFRAVGEGTGQSVDLDDFDRYYNHLLLWSKPGQLLVGGYRLGNTAEILPRFGIDGLYTSTEFRYDARFFARLGPAIELGRSFIRPEYQKQYAPLLVLWKGIGRYVAAFPAAPTLFGVVSISNRYSRSARHLMYRFLSTHQSEPELSRFVTPRSPFRPALWKCDGLYQPLPELDHVNDLVSDLEIDGKGVPILLKHYSKLGGKLAAFNVDAQFSKVLDGLIVVDLRRSDPTLVERYLGKEGAQSFRRHHRLDEPHS